MHPFLFSSFHSTFYYDKSCRRRVLEIRCTNGDSRVRCDKTNPYIKFGSTFDKREPSVKDLDIRENPPGSGNFVIFYSRDHSYTFCSKQGDRISCN